MPAMMIVSGMHMQYIGLTHVASASYSCCMKSIFTIVDDGGVRGFLAPAGKLSRKLLMDMIDFLELSSSVSQKETSARLRSSDWSSAKEVHKAARKAR
jgi:hypothetical protein